ncbi:hypothetical protein HALTITAN_1253 [Vreelandella titanicae BH1]|uniref:Uncharacterized protein n=1 Tax=Vreelandella titanicae BH1 TaxID=1204738 RepID=L9UAA2_9GAMM|nr:hypothetical protein HALTITAN_1253 [Halomonas titanicae BH1]
MLAYCFNKRLSGFVQLASSGLRLLNVVFGNFLAFLDKVLLQRYDFIGIAFNTLSQLFSYLLLAFHVTTQALCVFYFHHLAHLRNAGVGISFAGVHLSVNHFFAVIDAQRHVSAYWRHEHVVKLLSHFVSI